MNILTILIAVLAFGFLILIHELGHYLVARACHVRIYEFSIGMGPKLVWFDSRKTGIRYKLCMLPFGGYVSMADGEDDSAPSMDPAAFSNQRPWKRLLISAAGGVVNLVAGFILMMAVVLSGPMVSTVVADFPEEIRYEGVSTEADGLQSHDRIVAIDGKKVHTQMEMDYHIMRRGIEPVTVTVERGGEEFSFTVTFPTEVTEGQVVGTRDFRVYLEEKTLGTVARDTFYRSVCTVRMVWESIFDLITGRFSVEAVSGPVGITGTISDVVGSTEGADRILSLLFMISIISINLGVVNLFPLPALDGGRLVFILIEMIFRKPVPKKIEAKIHNVGLILLLIFALLVTFKDIRALF